MFRFFFLLICSFVALSAKETVCLNMIVKNEKDVIRRCLDSVIPVIDYWVIVDTGSEDGTQKIILEHLKDIPGELYERPWKNFEHNRNEALDLARESADYILFMDADDILLFEGEPQFPELAADSYKMWRGTESFSYLKPQLVRASLPWKWIGVTHEYLGCDGDYSSETLENVAYRSCDGGADGKNPMGKFRRDIQLLEAGLKEDPNNSRYAFYLAQSYKDAGEPGKAVEWYQKRVKMGGWAEEVYWSKLHVGLALKDMGLPASVVAESLIDAFKYRPHRPETLYYLAELYIQERNYAKAYEFLKVWEYIPKPAEKDSLFNMDWVEQYGLLFQLSIASYYLGHYEESLKMCDQLLAIRELPESWRAQTFVNRTFPLAKLEERTKSLGPDCVAE